MRILYAMPVIALAAMLAGCTSVPQPTLEQQMSGMNKAERAEFLYHECRKETRYRSNKRFKQTGEHNGHYHTEPETEASRFRLRNLCEEFYEQSTGQEH